MIYYAHCISIYNTPQEERDLETIHKLFPGHNVHNPNNEEDSKAYKEKGMEHFLELVKECDIFVFRGLPNGKIPSGIYKELITAIEFGKYIIELPCISGREMSIRDTKLFLTEIGYR